MRTQLMEDIGDNRPDQFYVELRDMYIKRLTNSYELHEKYRERVLELALYISRHKIKNLFIGVSGGLDSAVALAMLCTTRDRHCLKIDINPVMFNQSTTEDLGMREVVRRMCVDMNLKLREVDLRGLSAPICDHFGDEFAAAQLRYSLMYTMLFGYTQNVGGITVGTTNYDELGFVGWFGKSSDMLADIQPIHDFHKCQLRLANEFLSFKVPQEIINRAPTGDIPSGETDEQVFGCTYDDLSFITALENDLTPVGEVLRSSLELNERFPAVYALRRKNEHKYQGQGFNSFFIGRK